MAISSFPPASTGGATESVAFEYTTPGVAQIIPWSFADWTGAKVTYYPKNNNARDNGARVGFLNASRQPIGTTTLLPAAAHMVNNWTRTSTEISFLSTQLLSRNPSSNITLTGAPAWIVLFSPRQGGFIVEKSQSNTANAANGTLTTITSSNASFNLATASYVTVIGGGGGAPGMPAFNQSNVGGGSGYAVTQFVPAGTYNVTIGAGGAGGVNGNSSGKVGGDSSFVGGAVNIVALGGNKTPAGVTSQGFGGSGASFNGDIEDNWGGIDGRPGSASNTNGSGTVLPPWIPASVTPASRFAPGGLYGGGGSGVSPIDSSGGNAQANTGGGGGGPCSNSNNFQNGGNGGSGVVFVWTPAA